MVSNCSTRSDPLSSRTTGAIVLDLFSRSRKKNGDPTMWKEFRIAHTQAGTLPDPVDADLVPMCWAARNVLLQLLAQPTARPRARRCRTRWR